jgi:hypothetical protein
VLLLLFSLGGIAIMDFAIERAPWYWLAMAPLFGIVSTIQAWRRTTLRGTGSGTLLRLQLLHWGGLVLAVLLVFFLYDQQLLGAEATGLVALLSLALATTLAGVHFDGRFLILGLVLGLTIVAGVLADDFFWLLLIPAVIVGAILVARRKRTG